MITVEPLGDSGWLLRLQDADSATLQALTATLRKAALPGLADLVPAWDSVGLIFSSPAQCPSEDALHALIIDIHGALDTTVVEAGALHLVEVRYGGEHGPDLARVAQHCGLDPDDIIARHCAAEYRVRFLGFLPGFAYLEGMDADLATPRLATPRPRIAAGSVGIAGAQTGIYPLDSPGGWNLIGRTDTRLFDPDAATPCLLKPGDRLRFVAIRS